MTEQDRVTSLERRLSRLLFITPEKLQSEGAELLAMGEVLLLLISDWSAWLERRVETVRFLDADTVSRRVSVDFILPDIPSPLARDGRAVTVVPLGTLLKRELVNFSLRDEGGRPMPLLSRRQNGPLAAAVLIAGARMWVGSIAGLGDQLPLEVVKDLWNIATGDPDQAIDHWRRLRISRGQDARENDWRREMLASGTFMALARDLARNFLVLTPVVVEERRRVIKFSYQEVPGLPRVKLRPRAVVPKSVRTLLIHDRPVSSAGVGRVRVTASWFDDVVPAAAHGAQTAAPVLTKPFPGVRIKLDGDRGQHIMRTGQDGRDVVQVAVGTYSVTSIAPEGAFAYSHARECKIVRADHEVDLVFEFCAGPRFTDRPSVAPALTLREKAMRLLAISPKPIEISAPAVGQCHSYHLQFETADGFHIVEAELRHTASVAAPASPADPVELNPPLTPLQQRVGLSVSGVAMNRAAAATFSVRPRPSMIVRAAFYASLLGCLVLLFTILARESVSVNPGPWIGLLLIVPGGLSAYVARSRENLFATEVLIGLRSVAAINALWSFAAAAVLALSRELSTSESGAESIGSQRGWSLYLLLVFLAGNIATAVALFIAWRRAHRPPEFREAES